MVKLPYLSTVCFSGTDAGGFLHGQLSADVLALASGDSTFACYCEPKGRVLALMLVHRVNEDYYVIMSSALATAVTERLTIYRMRSKVTIEVLHEHTVMGLQADELLEPALTTLLSIPLPGGSLRLVVTDHDITAVTDSASQEAWKVSELRLGISWLGPGTSGEFLPQMLGFEQLGAVNYRKGCYPGQEIVARTHYLGKVKRHPRLLNCKLTTCPEPMEKINLLSDGEAYEAVIADRGSDREGNVCLLTVTRMEPDRTAQQLEYQDEITVVI